MPRCIAPGCTSGYDSNKEKVHFFYVPNDKETIKLWQAALRRKDFIVKAKQPVCEKHFLKSDILWHRTIYDKNRHILGVSAPFKIPRLKKNTIPTQFPWTEGTEEIKINVQNVQKEEVATKEIVLNNVILKEERKNLELSLDDIINIINTKQFYMPPQWTYLKYFNNNIKLLIFYVPMVNALKNSENKYSVYSQKEVVLKENMELEVNILKQSVAAFPFDIQIHNTIKSIEQLRETLYSINNFNVCLGANNITNEIEEIGYHLTYKDISGIWRHNKCPLILSHLEKKCKFCSNVKKSVQRKVRRTKIIKSMKKIRVSTNTQNEKKILLLRNKYYKAEKARKRSKYVANKLKEDLTNCKIKAEEISMKTIEDRLRDKKIPDNQLNVMREIIQATKCTNLKSRRYSEEWILLCMLMRMKSSTAYNFLRDNQILPLPCIRTIQRYIYINMLIV
ncbi:uncharacterized protein [Temnothorax nylanderi]|uniref:uncharacterized protein n=1 Tax=Temnothorax nylanderi TaxID=102681 RepID=UPI003A84FD19